MAEHACVVTCNVKEKNISSTSETNLCPLSPQSNPYAFFY